MIPLPSHSHLNKTGLSKSSPSDQQIIIHLIPNRAAKLLEDKVLFGGDGGKFTSSIAPGILFDKAMLMSTKSMTGLNGR